MEPKQAFPLSLVAAGPSASHSSSRLSSRLLYPYGVWSFGLLFLASMFYWAQDGASFVEGLNRINLPLNSLINHVKEMLDGIAIPNFYGISGQ